MLIPDLNLAFIHIQKTGGNAVSKALAQSITHPTKHYTAMQLRDLAGREVWQDYYSFAFVRNPWDRLVSWWAMIDAYRPRYEAGQPTNRFQKAVLDRAKTFDDFARLDIVVDDSDGRKSITCNQIDYLTDETGKTIVNFIGRFEQLEADLNRVLLRSTGKTVGLDRVNRSSHAHYTSYYPSDLADYVGRVYSRDIDAFGYRFEAP